MLVDGGPYNGQRIDGIGLMKPAHIYWRAQSVYQRVRFSAHADAIEQACADLRGCGGTTLGWYLDEIMVYKCTAP